MIYHFQSLNGKKHLIGMINKIKERYVKYKNCSVGTTSSLEAAQELLK